MAGEVSKKILWIFVFLILAAIAILGVLFIRGYQSGKQVSSIENTPEPAATDTAAQVTLTLSDPAADLATSSAKLTVTGKTTADAYVAVLGAGDPAITIADSEGNFSAPVTLTEGVNALQVQAFTDTGETTMTKRTVLYAKSL